MQYCNKLEKKDKKLIIALAIAFILNPLSHYINNVLEFGNTYYFSYVCWLFLFIMVFGSRNIKIVKNTSYIIMLLLMSFTLGAVWGEIYFDTGLSEFHISIMVCIAYLITMGISSDVRINKYQLMLLMRIIVLIGILSCIYAMSVQSSNMILVLRGINVSYNCWQYVSFYRQRNIFAEYCFIASIAGCFMFFSTKKLIYALCVLLFGLQIYITNSRAGLLAYVILVGFCIYQTRHNKVIFTIVTAIILFAVFYTFDLSDIFLERFSHSTSRGKDSSEIRVDMWIDCITELFDKMAIFFGFGAGSTTAYITPVYDVGSSHNSYVDTFFTGGLVYLGIILHSIIYTFKNIYAKKKNSAFFIVWISAIIAYCIYCMMEGGIALYASNYFSVTLTLLFVLIPRLYDDSQEELCEE